MYGINERLTYFVWGAHNGNQTQSFTFKNPMRHAVFILTVFYGTSKTKIVLIGICVFSIHIF